MSVSISGILLDPYGQPARFAEVKFITWQGAADVLTTSNSVFKTSEDGAYAFSVEFGTFTVQVRYNQSNGKFQTIKQKVIVNSTTTASTLGELLLFNEPLTPPEIAYVEQLVAEAEGYRDESESFALASEASSQTSEGFSQSSSGYADDSAASAAAAATSAESIAGVPLNGGVWAAGITFNSYNEYMIYSGLAYAPLPATTLPYVSTAAPDQLFVGAYPLGVIYEYIAVADMKTDANLGVSLTGSNTITINTKDHYSSQRGGGAKYLFKTFTQATADGDAYSPTSTGNIQCVNGVAVLQTVGNTIDLSKFGVAGSGDKTANWLEAMALILSRGGGTVTNSESFEFSSVTIPHTVACKFAGSKTVTLTSNSTTLDAVILGFEGGGNEFNFNNGISGCVIDATAARRSGSGRGLYANNADSNKVAFKISCQDLIIQNQPDDGCDIDSPELLDVDIICQNNGGRGGVISATNSKGINNKIKIRSIDNVGMPLDIDTNNSDINLCEALVRGETPTYLGLLMRVRGNGNTIANPDVELNGNPTEADILATTGIDIAGDGNKLQLGFFGNCGKSVDVGGRGTIIENPKLSIFSTNASNPVVGSVGIEVRSGALAASVRYEEVGTTRIESYFNNLSSTTYVQTLGTANGLTSFNSASVTYDPPTTVDGGTQVATVPLPSASLGDLSFASHTGLTTGIGGNNKVQITSFCVNGAVIVQIQNNTGSTLDIPSGTLKVGIIR